MRSRTIVIGSLAAALGAVGLAAAIWDDPGPPSPDRAAPRPTEDGDLRAVRQQVGALRSQLARLDQRVAQPAPDPAAAHSEPAAASAPSQAERSQAALEAQRRAVAFLADRVDREPHDVAWTSEIRSELAGSLDAGSGSSVRSVACGATLCRAEASYPGRDQLQRFVDSYAASSHRELQLFFERDGDALAATLFIARPGQRMPDLAKELGPHPGGPRTAVD